MLIGGTTQWWDPVYTASPIAEGDSKWASDIKSYIPIYTTNTTFGGVAASRSLRDRDIWDL